MPRLTDSEVMSELRSNSALNQARAKFSAACARLEQYGQQRSPISPVEMRRMEFEAIVDIIGAYNDALVKQAVEASVGTPLNLKDHAADLYYAKARDVTLADNLDAMVFARDELDSLHSQYGDKANARDHSAALRKLDTAITYTKYALGV